MSEIDKICLEKYGVVYVTIKSTKERMRKLIMYLWIDLKYDIDKITTLLGFSNSDTVINYIGSPEIKWKPTEKEINQYKKFLKIEHV